MLLIDGFKFPPICIFKGKRLSSAEKKQIPPNVFVWFQDNGWMNTDLMKKYVDYIKDIKVNRSGAPMMMVYDSFKGHLEDLVKKKFQDNGIDLAVIPAGLTSMCQPLDVAINKPFKDNLRKEWHLWMSHGGAGETAKGNLRRAKFNDVCWWVKRSWEGIPNDVIVESFKTCGISNTLVNHDDSDKENNYEELEVIDLTMV